MQKEKRVPDDVREILAQYPFRDPEIRFLRRNENEVFAVRDGAERFVLRIQRPAEGFSLRPLYGETSPAVYLDGELDLLEFLRECAEFPVQQPVRNRMGGRITSLPDGCAASMLTWVEGRAIDQLPLDRERCFRAGHAAAIMQSALAGCRIPARYTYDEKLLIRAGEEIARAADGGGLPGDFAFRAVKTIDRLTDRLPRDGNRMVHADLTPSNLLDTGKGIVPVDFSLAGYSRPEMDIAAFFFCVGDKRLEKSFLSGYRSGGAEAPDRELLDLFLVFQAVLYLACQHEKYRRSGTLPSLCADWDARIFRPFLAGNAVLPR